MNDLVECKNKQITTTSLKISKYFGKVHKDVVKIINNFDDDEFKGGNFTPLKLEYRGQKFNAFKVTQDGFLLLAMGFTGKKAEKWKKNFIVAFREMEKSLLQTQTNKSDIEWNQTRLVGKQARLEETDTIKEFVDYATDQGSKSAQFYYKHITNATYKALGLMAQKNPKLRDAMDIYEISQLLLAEKLASNKIKEYMDLGRHYKDIYKSVQEDLINFANAIKLN